MLIIILGRLMGIEPTNVGATIRCVNHFATIAMAGVVGIEPTLTVLETAVLPLNYTRLLLMGRLMGIEPTSVGATIRCVNHFATIAILVPEAGLEPATY